MKVKKIIKWILIALIILFIIFMFAETADAAESTGTLTDITEFYSLETVQVTRQHQTADGWEYSTNADYYHVISGQISDDYIELNGFLPGYILVYFGDWVDNSGIDIDQQYNFIDHVRGGQPVLTTSKPLAFDDLTIELPAEALKYKTYRMYESVGGLAKLSICYHFSVGSNVEPDFDCSDFKVYYYSGNIYNYGVEDWFINYSKSVDNPILDDNTYSDFISLNSHIGSDLTLLKIPFKEYYKRLNDKTTSYQKDAVVISFANAYYQQDNKINYTVVMYIFSPYIYGNYLKGNTKVYLKSNLFDNNFLSTGIEEWQIISSFGPMLKLKYVNQVNSNTTALNTLFRSTNKTHFEVTYIGIKSFGENVLSANSQEFQFLNETNETSSSTRTLSASNNNSITRSSSCVDYSKHTTTVDALCLGYIFDSKNNIWDILFTGNDNYKELFFCYFNVYTDNEKWTTSKQIQKISLNYSEQEVIDTYVASQYVSSDYSDLISYKYQCISPEIYSIEFPADTTYNTWIGWIPVFGYQKKEVTYAGLWNTNDTNFLQGIECSTNYDPAEFSDYTFALAYGDKDGYDYISKRVYLDTKITRTEVKIYDFLTIDYVENGNAYCVEVDESKIEFIQEAQPEDKAPVNIEVEKNPFEKAFDNIVNNINNFFSDAGNAASDMTGLILIVLILIAIIAIIPPIIKLITSLINKKKS